jgi:hypothetical protein
MGTSIDEEKRKWERELNQARLKRYRERHYDRLRAQWRSPETKARVNARRRAQADVETYEEREARLSKDRERSAQNRMRDPDGARVINRKSRERKRQLPEWRVRQIFRSFLKRCKDRGALEWRLEEEMAREMVQQPCHYCGCVPGPATWGGIDRLDSHGGYTEENTVPCCTACNMMKGVMKPDVFIKNCKRIAAHVSHATTAANVHVTVTVNNV